MYENFSLTYIGSYWVLRTCYRLQQSVQERPQQGPTTAPNVMHELKESQVNWQFFLGDAPMRAQPRTQQRPKAFQGVDMDLMETVTILITGVFSLAVAHALAHRPPLRQRSINHILVRIDHRTGFDRLLDERSDGFLLHILQHDDPDFAATLNHPKDRRLFLLECAPTGPALESPTAWRASLDLIGPALVPSHDIHLVALHHAAHPPLGTAGSVQTRVTVLSEKLGELRL